MRFRVAIAIRVVGIAAVGLMPWPDAAPHSPPAEALAAASAGAQAPEDVERVRVKNVIPSGNRTRRRCRARIRRLHADLTCATVANSRTAAGRERPVAIDRFLAGILLSTLET